MSQRGTPSTAISINDIRSLCATWKDAANASLSIGFVPTMGALHEGHLELVKRSKEACDKTVVSIFVNPTQFGPNEDFTRYPRTLAADMELLSSVGADAVFLPNAATIYPDGFQTYLHNHTLEGQLEGAIRPGHFAGVLTVVQKLFHIVEPDVCFFGKKDYQQWRLIEKMTHDLNMRMRIVGVDTVRDEDGLAKSSRNRYLSAEERAVAANVWKSLTAAKSVLAGGEKDVAKIYAAFDHQIACVTEMKADYRELRRQHDLALIGTHVDEPAVMLTAVRLGPVRLLDNMELDT